MFGRTARAFLGPDSAGLRSAIRAALVQLLPAGATPAPRTARRPRWEVATPRGVLRFASDEQMGVVLSGKPSATAAFMQELASLWAIDRTKPQVVARNRLLHTVVVELGPEWNPTLHDILGQILREMGAQEHRSKSFLAGSQAIDVNRFRIGKRRIKVVSETYRGITVRGAQELVLEISSRVAERVQHLGVAGASSR